ncbi:MAG: DctP family TRAP transporter solute-binding subunit [Nitrospirae bacterium]|nr:DctP family TRAP transporter solute-binding subunit [Nitrospirota bacterium]
MNRTNSKRLFIAIVVVSVITGLFLFYLLGWYSSKTANSRHTDEKVYELSFGHNMPADSAMHVAAQKYADTVSERTKNRVKITIHPSQQLANDHQMIEMAIDGQLDILLSPTAKLSIILPALQYSDIPFLFPKIEDAYEMLDGKPGSLLLERLKEHGLVGAAFWGNGFKQFTANKAIYSPKDFSGMNVRIMKSNLIMDQFFAFGANPIPIDFHQTYRALKDRVVDAQENPIAPIYSLKFYEVQSHLIISNHAYLAYVFCFSKKTLDSLPYDIVQILISTARELTAFERQQIAKDEVRYMKTISEAGVSITALNEKQIYDFHEATRHITDKYRTIIGDDVIDLTVDFLKKKYHYKEEDDIIIGLNADVSLGSALSGMAIKRGMELAVNEINKQGGVFGKKLSIVVMDHAGIPARSLNNVEQFSKMRNLVAIMGGLHSSVILSDLEKIHRDKIIYLIPWAAADKIVKNPYNPNYVFRISINDTEAAPFIIRQAMKSSRKLAFLIVNSLWGRENNEIMMKFISEKGFKPYAVEWFNYGEENMVQQITRIENSGAEIILLIATSPEGIITIKTLTLRQQKIPVLSHWSITGGYFWQDVKRELENIDLSFIQTFTFLDTKDEKTKRVIKQYMDAYHVKSAREISVPSATAQAYDLVHLLAIAINKAGVLDRPLIRQALENIDYHDGLIKRYSPPFTQTRHDALNVNDYFMARYDSNGTIVPINKGVK